MMSDSASALAMALWDEQWVNGVTDIVPDWAMVSEWVSNRTYPVEWLELAANGDVRYLVRVRVEAGLPPFV